MKEELRIYHFGNMYMSSIQQGIQAAHCQMEMFLKYDYEPGSGAMLYDWAHNHKTMICLNGGYHEKLVEIKSLFENEKNKYPFSHFYESQEALGGILTNVSIILPEKIFKTASLIKKNLITFDKDIDNLENENKTFNLLKVYHDEIKEVSDILLKEYEFNYFETQLIKLLNSCKLAT